LKQLKPVAIFNVDSIIINNFECPIFLDDLTSELDNKKA